MFKPKTFFMSHDEIRVANWCQACQAGEDPRRAAGRERSPLRGIVKDVDPKAEIVVWSDMFDPNHNAVDRYYLANGSFARSWEGLPEKRAPGQLELRQGGGRA